MGLKQVKCSNKIEFDVIYKHWKVVDKRWHTQKNVATYVVRNYDLCKNELSRIC